MLHAWVDIGQKKGLYSIFCVTRLKSVKSPPSPTFRYKSATAATVYLDKRVFELFDEIFRGISLDLSLNRSRLLLNPRPPYIPLGIRY